MSASVASSAVGLLDRHYSPLSEPPDHDHDADAQGWTDAMEVDRPIREQTAHDTMAIAREKQTPTAQDAQAASDRRTTIGGLLAALATNAHSTRRSATPPVDSPISPTSQPEAEATNGREAVTQHDPKSTRLLPTESENANVNDTGSTTATATAAATTQSLLADESCRAIPPTHQMQATSLAEVEPSIPFPLLDMSIDPFTDPLMQDPLPLNVKRQIDAYARLEFADGTFYLNTFQCELGRDQHAYRAALKRDQEAKEAAERDKHQPKSSSGKASQRSHAIKTAGSQVQGSVVSEAGGFAGVDDQPVEAFGVKRNPQDGKPHSSQASESSIVRPSEVLHNPSLAPYDYHKDVTYQSTQMAPVPDNDLVEDEQPAPVTADHLPDPHSCPLIPIHTTIASDQTEAENLKAISRRHIRIFWNWQQSSFFMEVLGRNGAFFEDEHMRQGESVRLQSGARIQISAVEFTFRLPDTLSNVPHDDDESVVASDDALDMSPNGTTTHGENGQSMKLKLRLGSDANNTHVVGPNGELKRRGPGRPPKNGIMSQREMKEREKAEKDAKARAISGVTSPPTLQRKLSKTQVPKPEPPIEAPKVEKRKYTKRKREDGEEDEVIPSIEGQDDTPAPENPAPQPPTKRQRSKSYSPPYKPHEECTPEDLARPPHNYAVLLYMVLSETGEITLRRIYKEMQSRWPYFKYVVDSDGWTSSVRHNLNQEVGKLFERGRKEGKGFTWLPKPNAMEEYQAQKNKRSNAPPVPKPRPAPQRTAYPPSQGQQLTWQNSGPMPQSDRPGEGFANQGSWPQQNGVGKPPQPGLQANGMIPGNQVNGNRPIPGQPPGLGPNRDPNYVPPPHLLPQHFGKPAPRFMPVTFEGLAVINRFEQSMFQNLRQDEETQIKWRAIFASAKGRCLHGATESSLSGGETTEEATIVKHVSDFVQRYKNPAFEGFKSARITSPAVVSTAAGSASPATLGAAVNMASPATQAAQVTSTLMPATSQAAQSSAEVPNVSPTAGQNQTETKLPESVSSVAPDPGAKPSGSPEPSFGKSDEVNRADHTACTSVDASKTATGGNVPPLSSAPSSAALGGAKPTEPDNKGTDDQQQLTAVSMTGLETGSVEKEATNGVVESVQKSVEEERKAAKAS